ncbi:CBU_0585 family protein [Piscirickettsia salmonis]|uniref:CBU_0585 family protein n=1 Tax=Piscirickettsia salmonis TaxID=1238 RepID=UPI0004AC8760|nr:CBU_0585 family protein [Piscirickettsia salmonis]
MKTKVNNKIQRSYVSDISKLLNTLSQNHPKTDAQRQEIDKSARITAKMTK